MDIEEKDGFKLNSGPTKPFRTLEQQLEILKGRGLIIKDKANALNILSRTNYYRFSAYSLTLRNEDVFDPDASFDAVYELYRFDDALRKIIMEFSSYIEIAFRSYVAYTHAKKHGPLGYMDSSNFINKFYHDKFIEQITYEIDRSDDVFVEHHKSDCGSVFPLWVAIECSSFGDLSKFYKNMIQVDKEYISSNHVGVGYDRLANWLQVCVVARNTAAHGGRFYNRTFQSVRVSLSRRYRKLFRQDSPFAYLFVIHRMLPTKALSRKMRDDLKALFEKYPAAEEKYLGMPADWLKILETSENKKSFDYDK